MKLFAVGDISLETKDNHYPFENITSILKEKDILFGNLETVLSDNGSGVEKAILLYCAPDKVRYLKEARFDVLNLANNHILDLGSEGLAKTLDTLNKETLNFIGISTKKYPYSRHIVEKDNTRVCFLGYSTGGFRDHGLGIEVNCLDENEITKDITEAKMSADIIVVSLHWGIEQGNYPSPGQIKLARGLIDTGASVILGHHPHVLQGIEKYKKGLIAYSLGNFQFKPNPRRTVHERTRQSMILMMDLSRHGVESFEIVPVKIDDNFVPCSVTVVEGKAIAEYIEAISIPIRENTINEKWWFEEIAIEYLAGNSKAWFIRIRRYGISHLLRCIKWLFSPFVLNCYLGLMRRGLKRP